MPNGGRTFVEDVKIFIRHECERQRVGEKALAVCDEDLDLVHLAMVHGRVRYRKLIPQRTRSSRSATALGRVELAPRARVNLFGVPQPRPQPEPIPVGLTFDELEAWATGELAEPPEGTEFMA